MRSLRKRKAAPIKLEETDSNDDGDDDGEFVLDKDIKSEEEDENLSDDVPITTPKKKSPAPKAPTSKASTTNNNNEKEKGVNDKKSDEGNNEADRPIATLNGGYSHTKKSRAKIGLANKGNTPWNKGRIRSEEDKVSFILMLSSNCTYFDVGEN